MRLPTELKSLKQFSGFQLHSITFPLASTVLTTAPSPTAHGVLTAHPAEGTEKRASPEARRLHYHRFAKGAAISDGVIAPFVVQSTPEAGAAPLHTCLPCRGKLPHGCQDAYRRLNHTRSLLDPERLHCTRVFEGAANCSTGVIAPFIVQATPETGAAPLHTCLPWRGKLAPRVSSHHSASRQYQKTKRLHGNNFSELGSTFTERQRGLPQLTSWSTPTTRSSEQRRLHAANYGSGAGLCCRYASRHASQATKPHPVQVAYAAPS